MIFTDAVQRNPSSCRAMDASLEKEVQAWLRQACDRDGGRQERYKRQSQGSKKGIGKHSRPAALTSAVLAEALECSESK